MDDRLDQRRTIRDIMAVCQSRYVLKELANDYLRLFELAKKLYDSVNLTDLKYNKRYGEVLSRFGELEEQARPFLAVEVVKPLLEKKKRGGTRQGAGRPGKGYKRRKITLSLLPEDWQAFDDYMIKENFDQAGLIRHVLVDFLDGTRTDETKVD